MQRHRGAQEPGHLGVVSNSLWPKSGVCASAGRDEAQEASKDQIRRGLVATELRLYPRVSGKPREKLRQGSGRLRLAVWKARSCVSAEGRLQGRKPEAGRPVKTPAEESKQETTKTYTRGRPWGRGGEGGESATEGLKLGGRHCGGRGRQDGGGDRGSRAAVSLAPVTGRGGEGQEHVQFWKCGDRGAGGNSRSSSRCMKMLWQFQSLSSAEQNMSIIWKGIKWGQPR